MKRFRNILLIVDEGTDYSAALRRVVTLARNNQALLSICTVLDAVPGDMPMFITAVTPAELRDIAVSDKRDWLDEVVKSAPADGAFLESKVLVGKPFIEIIHDWAICLRRFDFSGDLGKTRYALKTAFEPKEIDWSITNHSLVPVIKVAEDGFPQFRELVIKDMQQIGYDLEDFGIMHFSERYNVAAEDRYAVFTTEAGL